MTLHITQIKNAEIKKELDLKADRTYHINKTQGVCKASYSHAKQMFSYSYFHWVSPELPCKLAWQQKYAMLYCIGLRKVILITSLYENELLS